MKVLVTGHLGYIGTVMVPLLLKAGHDVVGCDSDLYERCTYTAGGAIADVPHLRKDVREVTAGDLDGIEAVIHLAALSNDPLGISTRISPSASTIAEASIWRPSPRKLASGGSCSPPLAAITAAPARG